MQPRSCISLGIGHGGTENCRGKSTAETQRAQREAGPGLKPVNALRFFHGPEGPCFHGKSVSEAPSLNSEERGPCSLDLARLSDLGFGGNYLRERRSRRAAGATSIHLVIRVNQVDAACCDLPGAL
jgi:hypothetical protein